VLAVASQLTNSDSHSDRIFDAAAGALMTAPWQWLLTRC
jgi:hypothetical protein